MVEKSGTVHSSTSISNFKKRASHSHSGVVDSTRSVAACIAKLYGFHVELHEGGHCGWIQANTVATVATNEPNLIAVPDGLQ